MFDIEVHDEAVQARLDAMTASLKSFGSTDMPQELTNWQIYDMHRKYPETTIDQADDEEVSAFTMIYPRSRTYERVHPHRSRPMFAKPKRLLSSMPVFKTSGIRHPVLRPVLFDMLLTRMDTLLSEKITWRSTSL